MPPEDASANSNTTRDGTLSDLHRLCDGIAAVIAVGGWGTRWPARLQRLPLWLFHSHNPVNRRDRPALEDRRQRRAMRLVQPRRLSGRLAVDETVRPLRIEFEHPVANDLQPNAADFAVSLRLAPS